MKDETPDIDLFKFEYNSIKDEVHRNSKVADTIKSIMIPIALGMLGWAVGRDLSSWKLLATGLASSTLLFFVWAICQRLSIVNRIFFSRQAELESSIEKVYSMDFRRKYESTLHGRYRRDKLVSGNVSFLYFTVTYGMAWTILVSMRYNETVGIIVIAIFFIGLLAILLKNFELIKEIIRPLLSLFRTK